MCVDSIPTYLLILNFAACHGVHHHHALLVLYRALLVLTWRRGY